MFRVFYIIDSLISTGNRKGLLLWCVLDVSISGVICLTLHQEITRGSGYTFAKFENECSTIAHPPCIHQLSHHLRKAIWPPGCCGLSPSINSSRWRGGNCENILRQYNAIHIIYNSLLIPIIILYWRKVM